MLGFRPTGFRQFTLTPQMPTEWNEYSLANIYACTDEPLTIRVQRSSGNKLYIRIEKNGKTFKTFKTKPGETVKVSVK